MPLSNEEDKGTNADGTKTDEYCIHCFEAGDFKGYTTVEEAIADSVNYAKYAGLTEAEMLAYAKENYPKLKRWRAAAQAAAA
jgi:hypothetical protein